MPLPDRRHSLGRIGEAYVAYRLAALGFEAYLTAMGTAAVDFRVVAPRPFSLQVKAATSKSWQVANKDDHTYIAQRGLYFALLVFDWNEREVTDCFVLRSLKVQELARDGYDAWRLRSPDAKPRGRRITVRKRDLQLAETIERSRDAWRILPGYRSMVP